MTLITEEEICELTTLLRPLRRRKQKVGGKSWSPVIGLRHEMEYFPPLLGHEGHPESFMYQGRCSARALDELLEWLLRSPLRSWHFLPSRRSCFRRNTVLVHGQHGGFYDDMHWIEVSNMVSRDCIISNVAHLKPEIVTAIRSGMSHNEVASRYKRIRRDNKDG